MLTLPAAQEDVASYLRSLMPHAGTNALRLWHSFDHRRVHFVVLDSEADYAAGSPQSKWLLEDLDNAEAAGVPRESSMLLIVPFSVVQPDFLALQHQRPGL